MTEPQRDHGALEIAAVQCRAERRPEFIAYAASGASIRRFAYVARSVVWRWVRLIYTLSFHQCACSTASTVAMPAIVEPIIPIAAVMPRGNSRLVSEARKIAATGSAITK